MSSFRMDTCSMSSSPLVNSVIKNQLFKTASDIDEPPFQFIHTMDLSVVDMMLCDSPDLVIHRTEIWDVWSPQVGCKKVWCCSSSTVACEQRGVPVHCSAGTKSLPHSLCITGSNVTSLWRREAASKKSVRHISRIFCFLTRLKLPHALQIYSTVFVQCTRLHLSR